MKAWLPLICILLLAACPVWAFSPREALAYRSKTTVLSKDKLLLSRRSAQWARVGSAGTLDSSAQKNSKQSYSLNLHYQLNDQNIAEHDRAASDAEREVAQLTRTDIAAALQAHAAWWEAKATLAAAQSREGLTALQLTEAERKHALGAISETDQELARIDHADAALSVQRAKQIFASAQAETARLALAGDAEPTTLNFALPAATVEQAPTFQTARWNDAVAKARERFAARNLTPALVMEAWYTGTTQLGASASTRGAASVTAGYPTLYDPTFLLYGAGWTYTAKVDLPIDPLGWAEQKSAKQEVSLADAALKIKRDELAVQLPKAKQNADASREQLALVNERRTLQRRKLELLRTKEAAGAASRTETLNAEATCGDVEAQLARAWGDYIKAVAAYLDLTDGTWEEAR